MTQLTDKDFWGESAVSKNSLKTGEHCVARKSALVTRPGRKQGRRSQASVEAKKAARAGQIEESRLKAEENWGPFAATSSNLLI